MLKKYYIFSFRNNPAAIKIRAGEWDAQTTKESLPFQESDITRIIIHSAYQENILHNDIALLELKSPVTIADNVNTVCLPPANKWTDSNNCFASGWGKDVFGKSVKYQD